MGLKKGQTNNPNGRRSGSKNERTKQWENLGESIVGKCAERFQEELFALKGKEFVQMYIQVLNFFKPKYQSTELKADQTSKVTVVYESEPIPTASEASGD
jgi:hypothetical protein